MSAGSVRYSRFRSSAHVPGCHGSDPSLNPTIMVAPLYLQEHGSERAVPFAEEIRASRKAREAWALTLASNYIAFGVPLVNASLR